MRGPRTVALAIVSTSLGNLPLWLLTGLAPQIGADLGFGNVGLGSAVAIFFGVSALAALRAGRLVESIGWHRGMILSAALCALALTCMGLVATSLPALVGLLGLAAVAFTISQPSANVALADHVAEQRQGVAFGVKQASLPLTTLLVGVSVPLFAHAGGWRWAFVSAAVLTGVFLVLLMVTLPRPRPVLGAHPLRRGRRARTSRPTRERVRPRRALVILAVGSGLASTATASLGGFLVVYGVSTGLTPSMAGRLLAVASVVCLISRLVTGYVADRRGRRHLFVVSVMMLVGSAGYGLLALGGDTWLLVLGALIAFGIGWAWNGLYAFAIVLNHRWYPAMATGVVQTAIGTGSAVGPLAFGVTVSVFGYSLAWSSAGLALAAGAGMVALGRRYIARDAR